MNKKYVFVIQLLGHFNYENHYPFYSTLDLAKENAMKWFVDNKMEWIEEGSSYHLLVINDEISLVRIRRVELR